jgi:hypothetical protein
MPPQTNRTSLKAKDLCLVAFLALASGIAWMLTKGPFLSGDEAVVGLMALKISQGADFPLFFWGAHYSGPLASYLAAPLHWFLKPSVFLLWVPAVVLHLIYASGVFLLARRMSNEQEALAAGLCAALPFDLFPYAALGGYTESLSLTPWLFLLICRPQGLGNELLSGGHLALAGLLVGFVLWVFPVSVPMACTSLVYVRRFYGPKALGIMLSFTLVGLIPFFAYNVTHPGASVLRLLARTASLDKGSFLKIAGEEGLTSLALLVLGNWGRACIASVRSLPAFTLQLFHITPGANGYALAAGMAAGMAFLMTFWAGFGRERGRKDISRLLVGLVLYTYTFTALFGLDRHRYLIPALFLVPFGCALALDRLRHFMSRPVSVAILGILLALNGFSNFWSDGPPPPPGPDLARFLEARGLDRGYAEYDLAYPLVYLSNERLIYTPFFHSPQYDRYAPYTEAVNRSERPTFLFCSRQDALFFRRALKDTLQSYKEETWRHISIFHSIHPGVDVFSLKLNLSE